MSSMKKIFAGLVSVFLLLCVTGCSKNSSGKKPVVLCSTFPVYDWCRNILGETDHYDLQLLNTKGTDMHSFQPTVQDLAKIASCEILFYVGGESEKWIEDALESTKNENRISASLMSMLGNRVKQETAEGIFESESEDEEKEDDEHVWLSLGNAGVCCFMMTSPLRRWDSENGDTYYKNMKAYSGELEDAFEVFNLKLSDSEPVLFADRFPFRYFADDFDLECYAAFPGCSAETEASFSTVIKLAEVVQKNNLGKIFVLENSNTRMADQIIQTAGTETEIRVLNSMQGISEEDIKNGATYLSIMTENLKALTE